MEKWHETWKNLVAIKNSPLTPLKQYKIHLNYWSRKEGLLIWSTIEVLNFLFKWNPINLHIYI